MAYTLLVWDRKRWQTERDKAGVKKGACSKVSVGGELDKFHKAHGKDFKTGAKQAANLKKALVTYCAAITKKPGDKTHKDFVQRIQSRLIVNVDNYITYVDDTAKARDWYPSELEKARSFWNRLEPEFKEWKSTSREGEDFVHKGNKELVKGLTAALLKSGNAAKQLSIESPKYKAHCDALAKLGSTLDGGLLNAATGDKIDTELKKMVT